MKKLFIVLSVFTLLTGCQSKIQSSTYKKDDSLHISSEQGDDVIVPYSETMTIQSKDGYVVAGIDEVIYKMNDNYFKEHPEEKKTLHDNLSNGIKGSYTDANPDALRVITRVQGENNEELYVKISVNFDKMTSYGDVISLFGLTTEDFNEDKKVPLENVIKYLNTSGFSPEKVKQ